MALGSTQPLTEMSTEGPSWGVKAAGAMGLTTLPPSRAELSGNNGDPRA